MPRNTVRVDDTTKWANPYVVGSEEEIMDIISPCGTMHRKIYARLSLQHSLGKFVIHCHEVEYNRRIKRELRGKNLACWCPLGQPCHADILLKIANA